LTAEVSGTRQAVRTLTESWERRPPVDTTETLGVIVSRLNTVAQQLAVIEAHPALKLTPAQHAQAVVAAGERILAPAVQKVDGVTRDIGHAHRELAELIGTTRGRREQWEWLVVAAVTALLVGILISPVLASWLPFGGDSRVAAFIMKADRWNAGGALMQAEHPESWRDILNDLDLVKRNQATVTACREAAEKTKKEQHCVFVVPSGS
jgi:hypothetical protein